MAYYKDLREYIKALDEKGKLVRVSHPVNKDTELHPLVRLQFRGLPEEERKTFYFDNIYDSQGKKYSIPVVVATLGASPQVYAIGMMCEVEEIGERWEKAQLNPIDPVMVKDAPVHEVVLTGDLSSLTTEPCPCGRTSYKLTGVLGRAGEEVKARGMFIHPRQVQEVMARFDQISRFQVVVRLHDHRDEIIINLELKDKTINKEQLAEGWLCPALFKYFETAAETIYVKAEQL